jgi:hypothetical protein
MISTTNVITRLTSSQLHDIGITHAASAQSRTPLPLVNTLKPEPKMINIKVCFFNTINQQLMTAVLA